MILINNCNNHILSLQLKEPYNYTCFPAIYLAIFCKNFAVSNNGNSNFIDISSKIPTKFLCYFAIKVNCNMQITNNTMQTNVLSRYAVSVLWVLDSDCNVLKTWFGRTVIRSSYKLFYEVHLYSALF